MILGKSSICFYSCVPRMRCASFTPHLLHKELNQQNFCSFSFFFLVTSFFALLVVGLRFLFLLLSCGVQLESISRDGDLWSRSLGMGRNWILDVIPSPVIGKWKARTTKVTIPLLKRKRSEKKVFVCFPPVFFLIPSLTSPPFSIPLYYDI